MIGIGTDILDIRRIEKTISRFGNRFKKRIFTESEIKKCESRKLSINCYAKNHLESLMPKKKEASVNLTITDEYPYAHAIVVIESN